VEMPKGADVDALRLLAPSLMVSIGLALRKG